MFSDLGKSNFNSDLWVKVDSYRLVLDKVEPIFSSLLDFDDVLGSKKVLEGVNVILSIFDDMRVALDDIEKSLQEYYNRPGYYLSSEYDYTKAERVVFNLNLNNYIGWINELDKRASRFLSNIHVNKIINDTKYRIGKSIERL